MSYKSKKYSGYARKKRAPRTLEKLPLVFNTTADQYMEQKVETNASEDELRCMLVHKILVHLEATEEADDTAWWQIQINRQSKAALVNPNDADCIHSCRVIKAGAIAAGAYEHKEPFDLLEDVGPILFGSRQFYVALDYLTGDAEVIYVDIWFEDVVVSANKFNRSW